MRRPSALLTALAFATAMACGAIPAAVPPVALAQPASTIEPIVLGELGHDTSAWIEGLDYAAPDLYEGTGVAGQSQLRQLDPATGAVMRSAAIPHNYYGEGAAVVGDRIWELTWRDGVAVEWDRASLTPLREVPIDGEGWGLCSDGARLIRSDGTNKLRFHDPKTFAETGSVDVTVDGQPQGSLNELECVDGQVWANIWQTDTIARIDPGTGVVNTVVDASKLSAAAGANTQKILNGIAHIAGDEYLLTGKYWPTMYRVRLDPPA